MYLSCKSGRHLLQRHLPHHDKRANDSNVSANSTLTRENNLPYLLHIFTRRIYIYTLYPIEKHMIITVTLMGYIVNIVAGAIVFACPNVTYTDVSVLYH